MSQKINIQKIELLDRVHKNGINRDDRTIEMYDAQLSACTGYPNLDTLIDEIETNNGIRWIDYCCGQGIALRQGTQRYKTVRQKQISSIGVDLRRFDELLYLDQPTFIPGETSFYQHDIEQGVIANLSPNLITCIKGLLYTEDPIKIIQEMYETLPRNAFMLFTIDTGNEILNESTPLCMYILENLTQRGDKVSAAVFDNEEVLLVHKQNASHRSIDLGLKLWSVHPGINIGWKRNFYVVESE